MMFFKKIRVFSVVGAAALAVFLPQLNPVSAYASDCKAVEGNLAGLYELTGVMETGSIVILLPDGRFGYKMTYGAYDEWAKGCWSHNGTAVNLDVREMETNHSDGKKFKTLNLKLSKEGHLIRSENGKPWGGYERVQKF